MSNLAGIDSLGAAKDPPLSLSLSSTAQSYVPSSSPSCEPSSSPSNSIISNISKCTSSYVYHSPFSSSSAAFRPPDLSFSSDEKGQPLTIIFYHNSLPFHQASSLKPFNPLPPHSPLLSSLLCNSPSLPLCSSRNVQILQNYNNFHLHSPQHPHLPLRSKTRCSCSHLYPISRDSVFECHCSHIDSAILSSNCLGKQEKNMRGLVNCSKLRSRLMTNMTRSTSDGCVTRNRWANDFHRLQFSDKFRYKQQYSVSSDHYNKGNSNQQSSCLDIIYRFDDGLHHQPPVLIQHNKCHGPTTTSNTVLSDNQFNSDTVRISDDDSLRPISRSFSSPSLQFLSSLSFSDFHPSVSGLSNTTITVKFSAGVCLVRRRLPSKVYKLKKEASRIDDQKKVICRSDSDGEDDDYKDVKIEKNEMDCSYNKREMGFKSSKGGYIGKYNPSLFSLPKISSVNDECENFGSIIKKGLDLTAAQQKFRSVLPLEALVIRRNDEVYYELPKGHLEKGESPEEAAIRELREETGLQNSITVGCSLLSERYTVKAMPWERLDKSVQYFRATFRKKQEAVRNLVELSFDEPNSDRLKRDGSETDALDCPSNVEFSAPIATKTGLTINKSRRLEEKDNQSDCDDEHLVFGSREEETKELRWVTSDEAVGLSWKSLTVLNVILMALSQEETK